jgi:hypothetical protein
MEKARELGIDPQVAKKAGEVDRGNLRHLSPM